jgi:hypothetical protein
MLPGMPLVTASPRCPNRRLGYPRGSGAEGEASCRWRDPATSWPGHPLMFTRRHECGNTTSLNSFIVAAQPANIGSTYTPRTGQPTHQSVEMAFRPSVFARSMTRCHIPCGSNNANTRRVHHCSHRGRTHKMTTSCPEEVASPLAPQQTARTCSVFRRHYGSSFQYD